MTQNDPEKAFKASFDAMESLFKLWQEGSQVFLTGQQKLSDAAASAKAAGGAADAKGGTGHQGEADRLTAASRSFSELWASAVKMSGQMLDLQAPTDENRVTGLLMSRIFDPLLWLSATGSFDKGFDQMTTGPRFADMFNTERKFSAVFNAWLVARRRAYEHQSLMLRAWTRATMAFTKSLNEKAAKGEKFTSWREVMTLWIETANKVLLETQRTEDFLASQRELMNASTDLRLAQQEIGEFYSEIFALPARTEIDDVHKALTDLRREFRAFKRSERAPPARKRQAIHGEVAS